MNTKVSTPYNDLKGEIVMDTKFELNFPDMLGDLFRSEYEMKTKRSLNNYRPKGIRFRYSHDVRGKCYILITFEDNQGEIVHVQKSMKLLDFFDKLWDVEFQVWGNYISTPERFNLNKEVIDLDDDYESEDEH